MQNTTCSHRNSIFYYPVFGRLPIIQFMSSGWKCLTTKRIYWLEVQFFWWSHVKMAGSARRSSPPHIRILGFSRRGNQCFSRLQALVHRFLGWTSLETPGGQQAQIERQEERTIDPVAGPKVVERRVQKASLPHSSRHPFWSSGGQALREGHTCGLLDRWHHACLLCSGKDQSIYSPSDQSFQWKAISHHK